jgi:hypothetical protein
MEISEFKTIVAAYANRELASFVQGVPAVDLLLRATNNAKKWAQRQLDFELARDSVVVQVDAVNGGLLTEAVLQSDTSTVAVINRIERAYLQYSSGGYRPIDFMTKARWASVNKRRWECAGTGNDPLNERALPTSVNYPQAIVQQGQVLFFSPIPTGAVEGTTLTIALDVIRWLPDYSDANTTDFFLEHCADWLMYRTLRELNFFLKDGQRVQVTDQLVNESWTSVVEWNGSINNFTDDNSLD